MLTLKRKNKGIEKLNFISNLKKYSKNLMENDTTGVLLTMCDNDKHKWGAARAIYFENGKYYANSVMTNKKIEITKENCAMCGHSLKYIYLCGESLDNKGF